jgi:hypothetical protein
MAGLIVVGLLLVHVAGRGGPKVGKEEAVEIARPRVDFEPDDHQIRFLRRGIPPRGYWIVSFFVRKEGGGYKRITVVVVDSTNGEVTEVRRAE